MQEGESEGRPPEKPVDVLEMWLEHRSPATLEAQSWVTDDGLYAIRWFGDRPPTIVRLKDHD